MSVLKPVNFWATYREAIRPQATLSQYMDAESWTKVTRDAAMLTINGEFKSQASELVEPSETQLTVTKEYYRIDVIGSEEISEHNWHLRIAFEHENNPKSWTQELCKLCHVIADLRVVVGYHQFNNVELMKPHLQQQIDKLTQAQEQPCRITGVPHSQWLFVFGPTKPNYHLPFVAFRLNGTTVVQLPEDEKDQLIPAKFPL